ncbi:hypothetical protein C8Q74DRAFT_1368094 [Fomes fomentarius]|nr:hypothetical protein C8Q74DRAFT_1368094 [Fomes fomentarius]
MPLTKPLLRHIFTNLAKWHERGDSDQGDGLGLDIKERDLVFISGVTTPNKRDLPPKAQTPDVGIGYIVEPEWPAEDQTFVHFYKMRRLSLSLGGCLIGWLPTRHEEYSEQEMYNPVDVLLDYIMEKQSSYLRVATPLAIASDTDLYTLFPNPEKMPSSAKELKSALCQVKPPVGYIEIGSLGKG